MNERERESVRPGAVERPGSGFADETARRGRLEALITSISTELAVVATERLDGAIGHALQRVGEALDADRAWICRVAGDGRSSLTHEWCAQGGSAWEAIDGVRLDDRAWLGDRLSRGETVPVRDRDDLPPEASTTRRFLVDIEAVSLVAVPLGADGLKGWAGFAARRATLAGSSDDVALMRFVGDILADALDRLDDEAAGARPAAPGPEELLRTERDLLERILVARDADTILPGVCNLVECGVPGMRASLFRLDPEAHTLLPVVTGGLPGALLAVLDGLEPGLDAGPIGLSCDGERVVVADLMRDASVQTYRAPALESGFRSCWTEPVRDAGGRVVGVLALFGRRARTPAPTESEWLADGARIAGLALEPRNQVTAPAPIAVAGSHAVVPDDVALQRSSKLEALGQLCVGVTHDFNNILTAILGTTELALDGIREGALSSGADVAAPLEQIRRAGERAKELTGQLLAFGRERRDPATVDPNTAIGLMKPILCRLIGDSIRIETLLDPDTLPVRLEGGQFEQLILNLALNARDAMPAGGRLSIETSSVDLDDAEAARGGARPGRYTRIRVRDNGFGMDRETQERIFRPFFTTKAIGEGTGLGLAIVHGVVTRSGGHIVVDSEPDRGTTFTIHVPALPREAKAAPVAPACSETVLICEDDEMVRERTTGILESAGYIALRAANAAHALHVAEHHPGPIHLFVADVTAAHRGGFDPARRLRERRPGLRVLFTAANAAPESLHWERPANDGWLSKPFSASGLLAAVRAALDQA